jgi:hypothetical protein
VTNTCKTEQPFGISLAPVTAVYYNTVGSLFVPKSIYCILALLLLSADNHLGDSGVELLASALKDKVTLNDLDLAGNNITAVGLRHLASIISPAARLDTSVSHSLPVGFFF